MAQRGKVGLTDWLMLLLAVISVGLIAYETWGDPTAEQRRQIILADYGVIAIFAVEYLLRLARADNRKAFVARNWYDLLGMIPVSHPAVRGFRLFRLVRIVVILSRFGRAADRAFGEEFTYRVIRKFKNIIAEVVSDAVLMRILDQTGDVLLKGEYTHNLANSLETRGDEMLEIVVEKIGDDPKVGRIRHMPFFDEVVATSSRVSQRLMIDLLRDPRMDVIVKDIIRQNLDQIKAEVRRKEAAAAGR